MKNYLTSGIFAFEILDPETVLPRFEWYLTRSKFARGDWNHRRANLRLSDGKTPLGKTRFFAPWYTLYLRPSMELTADYREMLIETGEEDIELDGKVYRPCRLDEKPDLSLSKSGRVNVSDRIVSSPERQIGLALNFDYYVERKDTE